MSEDQSTIRLRGKKPGKTLAFFAGIHGNEKAGIFALEQLVNELTIESGTVYLVFANPPAIKKSARSINKNLNRCFLSDNNGTTWEDQRARELMKLLDGCDALVDLHGYNGPENSPFIIADTPGFDLAKQLEFRHVIRMGSIGRGGTDYYMSSKGKVGLCLECGSNFHPEKYVELAKDSVKRTLSYFGLTPAKSTYDTTKQDYYEIEQIVKRETDDFEFDREYSNFDRLNPGQQFARDGQKSYIAKENQYIIFPRSNQVIGEEAFIIISKASFE